MLTIFTLFVFCRDPYEADIYMRLPSSSSEGNDTSAAVDAKYNLFGWIVVCVSMLWSGAW